MAREVTGSAGVRPGLALALVFLVVGLLFLSTGFLDLRRTEEALLDLVGARADALAAGLGATMEDLVERALAGDDVVLSADGVGGETTLFDVIAGELLETLRAMASVPHPPSEGLGSGQVVLLGQDGAPELPAGVRERLRPLLEGRSEVALDLFGGGHEAEAPRFAALALPGGGPVAVLLVGEEDFRRRALEAAAQAAAEAAAGPADVIYVEVTDAGGRLLGWGGEEAPPSGLPVREPPTRARAEGVELLEVAAGWRLAAEDAGWVRVGLRPEAVQGILSRHRLRLWLTTSLLTAVGLFAVGLLYRVQVRHHRALGELQERLARARRLSALGRLGAALAHEIRNPLNALGLGLQRIQRELLPPEGQPREAVGRLTALMRDEVRRLDALVGEFLAASPETRGPPVLFPVAEVVRQTLALLEEEARARGVRVEARIPEAALRVLGDGDKLRQALLNLLRNALEAIPGEGEVRVVVDVPEARRVRIRVQDSGAGIPREDRERIFDPAFTTKEKGLGLGLAVAHEIVNAHGGELRVASRVGGGTAVDVWLPLAG